MDNFYDTDLAQVYDLMYPDLGQTELMGRYFNKVSSGNQIMELGIGTGRLAIPLSAAGFNVSGVDVSEPMLTKLKEKDHSSQIETNILDFSVDQLDNENNDICLLACNTFFSLQETEQQYETFLNARRTLSKEGVFVIEAFSPTWLLSKGQSFAEMRRLSAEKTLIEQYSIDQTTQLVQVDSVILSSRNGEAIAYTHKLRYVYPFEMDAIARSAGFELLERTSGFDGELYNAALPMTVSTYWRNS